MTTNNKQQTTNNKQQTTNNKQQTTNNKQQTTNNKQQTTITFILPVYNTSIYLRECLDSILNQEIDKEIIIIDDGSTDNSLSVILDYQNRYSNILLIRQHNEGLSASRNKAVKLARGEYIYFIDSDDYLVGDLKAILDLGSQYECDLIRFGGVWKFEWDKDSSFNAIPYLFSKTKEEQATLFTNGYSALLDLYNKGIWFSGLWLTLIKRDYIEKYSLSFKEGILAEDQIYYLQLLTSSEQCKIIEIPSYHYIYRQRGEGTITARKDEQYVIDHFRMIKIIFDYMNTKPDLLHPAFLFVMRQLLNTALSIVQEWEDKQKLSAILQEENRLTFINHYYPDLYLQFNSLINI